MTDILQPIPQDQIATAMRARWHQIILTNEENYRCLTAQGQYVPVRVPDDGSEPIRVAGVAVRDPSLDLVVAFDPTNQDHVTVVTLLDKIVKDAYAAKIAPAPDPDPTPAP